ncbi:hypothetical protein LCGC14_0175840 [marine sediment metagenome]|uniref:Uncharacterized protein n=1 Tax=marine sediment metagenome TaxID=412755 RepID=A0A0F9URF1_9ZZZZ
MFAKRKTILLEVYDHKIATDSTNLETDKWTHYWNFKVTVVTLFNKVREVKVDLTEIVKILLKKENAEEFSEFFDNMSLVNLAIKEMLLNKKLPTKVEPVETYFEHPIGTHWHRITGNLKFFIKDLDFKEEELIAMPSIASIASITDSVAPVVV